MTAMTELEARHNISANVNRLLANRGWKTLRLVEAVEGGADVTQNTIYRIVRGESTGSIPVLASIAEALGVSVDYLIANPDVHEQKLGKKSHRLASSA